MAAKRHITIAIAGYLLAFAVTLRIFVNRHHFAALGIILAIWAVLTVWLRFGGGQ